MLEASILIITYNQAEYIGRALESALGQAAANIEVLIGDDASTDGTAEAVQAAAKEKINVIPILRETNIGASANLYDLITKARGKYIAVLEGDDYWSTDKLRKQIDFMNENPSCLASVCNTLCVDGDGERRGTKLYWLREKDNFSFSDFKGLFLPGQISSLIFKREEFGSLYLEPITKLHPQISDRVLFMLLLIKGNIRLLDTTYSYYRISDGASGITNTLYGKSNNYLPELALTFQLAVLAKSVSGKNHTFAKRKLICLGNILLNCLLHPSTKAVRAIPEAYRITGNAVLYALLSPIAVIAAASEKLLIKLRRYNK